MPLNIFRTPKLMHLSHSGRTFSLRILTQSRKGAKTQRNFNRSIQLDSIEGRCEERQRRSRRLRGTKGRSNPLCLLACGSRGIASGLRPSQHPQLFPYSLWFIFSLRLCVFALNLFRRNQLDFLLNQVIEILLERIKFEFASHWTLFRRFSMISVMAGKQITCPVGSRGEK